MDKQKKGIKLLLGPLGLFRPSKARTLFSDLSHRLLDLAWERYRVHVAQQSPRGSTGRGITPAFGDETGQWQIYYQELVADKDTFAGVHGIRIDDGTWSGGADPGRDGMALAV